MYNYYFAIASQNFLMNEEPVEEILRERTSYYKSINKDIDFWFVINPTFIQSSKLNYINQELIGSYAAIVSLDQQFIQWLKLRIGFVEIGHFESKSLFTPTETSRT
uniref:Ycf54 n=1 Tax=Schimmelmannia schousboei TaxID=173468 RepID=A0A1C9C8U8_9FLOR|nr:hypothetical protein Schim_120 [Schimmelmannia schousboei]AOM64801.1 hypothetical protein Schim_120 [Schimmelmannia schousboei]